MDSQTSRKIIVAGAMAAVLAIGVVTWALRSHPVTSVAQAPQPPPPVAQIPATAPSIAQIPDAPAAVDQIPEVPSAIAHDDSAETKSVDTSTPSAVEPKRARGRHVAKADTSAVAPDGIVTRTGSVADTSEKPAAETVAHSVADVKSADELTPPPTDSSSPVNDLKVPTSTDFAASDSQITTDVKSAIARDSLSNDANIEVTTTQGVVVLTGSLANQDAIDQVKDVAGKVKDVKSVDASALILASR
jgi:hyperosmotically inducible protein